MPGVGERYMSDGDYSKLWSSLQQQENHVCTRMCEFRQVFGNMFYCVSSGQAHVCDQNCAQRIFYDNHHDICRLSRRVFPRAADEPMAELPRKRSGEDPGQMCVKRTASDDWQRQQQQVLQEQAVAAQRAQQHATLAAAQQQQQQFLGGTAAWTAPPQPAAPQGWAC